MHCIYLEFLCDIQENRSVASVAYLTLQTTQVLTAFYSLYGSTEQLSYLQYRSYLL